MFPHNNNNKIHGLSSSQLATTILPDAQMDGDFYPLPCNLFQSNHPLTVRNLTGNAPRQHWVTKGRLSNPVVTGLFRRGQHSSIMNRALPLNELSQAYLENDLHRIIDLANKQSRSVRSSQDNGNAKSRLDGCYYLAVLHQVLFDTLINITTVLSQEVPGAETVWADRQGGSRFSHAPSPRWGSTPAQPTLLKERFGNSQLRESKDLKERFGNSQLRELRSIRPLQFLQRKISQVLSPTVVSVASFSPQASSTRMVHGPYAPVSGGPPDKSTLVLSTSSSSDEDDSHILGYRAFSAACERSVSVVSKRLGELCKRNHLQDVRRKLQDTFVKSHSKDPPVSYSCFSHSKDPPVSSQRCNHTNPQQTTATQTKPSECHKSTSPSSQETLPEHLPLSETILDPLEYLKKAFGDAPMNFNCSRTVKNRSKEATVSTYESDMSQLLDTHVYPSTSWEHGSLQPRDRDWYSPAPRELFQRESRVYQEPEERRMPCASYPYQIDRSDFPCKNLQSHQESRHKYWRINPIGCSQQHAEFVNLSQGYNRSSTLREFGCAP
ncbi:unnamed protein product [Timema podura]|uniref:Uncharacterized protein n=1 Tax=Timema podura TaxID=61482 RepID=A0ABN7NNY0_TIMPD|nr:unnamed protein product [Timema podura]